MSPGAAEQPPRASGDGEADRWSYPTFGLLTILLWTVFLVLAVLLCLRQVVLAIQRRAVAAEAAATPFDRRDSAAAGASAMAPVYSAGPAAWESGPQPVLIAHAVPVAVNCPAGDAMALPHGAAVYGEGHYLPRPDSAPAEGQQKGPSGN